MKKLLKILIQSIPVLIMIGLIPLIKNDYILTLLCILIIAGALALKNEKNDFIFLIAGFFIMIISESIFISTGVETFVRHSLLNIMPLWLPVLWAYAFVAMRRSIKIIEG